ncbi:MAG: DUF4435 domain-containing protein [Ilumatobacteraceae bacterium]|jgi:hypothetical protein|nr:DUF4435 domain-containing protein [Ilumatobacteraceae bacterium]
MSTLEDRIEKIKTQFIGRTGLRVLLVEGSDDVDAYRIFLGRKFPEWEKSWILVSAGSKADVVKMITRETGWLGLVDRDEWTEAEMTEKKAECPNLTVLPRFCLESYLIDPAELWAAFPEKQRAKIAGGQAQFSSEVLADLAQWVRHAALWHGVRPLWHQLRRMGFPDSISGNPPMPDDATLREMFIKWHVTLDADAVLASVHALEAKLGAEDVSKLCAQWLHAKRFYPQVVHQTLNRLLGQKPAKDRRLAILRTRTVPDDLLPLWQAMKLAAAT